MAAVSDSAPVRPDLETASANVRTPACPAIADVQRSQVCMVAIFKFNRSLHIISQVRMREAWTSLRSRQRLVLVSTFMTRDLAEGPFYAPH